MDFSFLLSSRHYTFAACFIQLIQIFGIPEFITVSVRQAIKEGDPEAERRALAGGSKHLDFLLRFLDRIAASLRSSQRPPIRIYRGFTPPALRPG
jgi:hypothetical protein